MSIAFSSSELLEMAERIESDGHNFYRKAAELFDNHYIHDLLINLAQWEKKHKELFASLREQLSSQDDEDSNIDSNDDLSLYLRAMEGLDVFRTTKDTTDELTGNERINDVLKIALGKDKRFNSLFCCFESICPNRDRKTEDR